MKRTEKKMETVSFPETVPEMEGKPKRGRKPRATNKQEAEVAAVSENITETESATVSGNTTETETAPVPEITAETEVASVNEITEEEETVSVNETTTEEESVFEPENITEEESVPVPEDITEEETAPATENIMEEESASEPESTTESEPEPTHAVNPAVVQIVESPLKLMKQEFQKRAQVIKEQMRNIQNAFITIGFQLHWIRNNNMYRVLNYKNVYEYAEKEYGIKKTTCCNFISIIENYADRDENGEVIESISGCYRNYSAGQLVAMLGMPDEMKQQVSPDMSVRAIKRLKQGEPESPAEKIVPVKEAATAPVEVPTASKEILPGLSDAEEMAQDKADEKLPEEAAAPEIEDAAEMETMDTETGEETVEKDTNLLEEENAASMEEVSENAAHGIPGTLMEIDSYKSYQNMADRLDGMIKNVFSGSCPVRVRVVCVQG